MKKCANPKCSNTVSSTHKSAKYCSSSCRAQASQHNRGLGMVSTKMNEETRTTDPLLLNPNPTYDDYGPTVPRFIFTEKVNHINQLTEAYKSAQDKLAIALEELRNLRTEKMITEKMRNLEKDSKPSALAGIADAIATPDGIQAIISGLPALLNAFKSNGTANPAISSAPGEGILCSDPNKNVHLRSIATALNSATDHNSSKATSIMLTLLVPENQAALDNLYNDMLKSAGAGQPKAA